MLSRKATKWLLGALQTAPPEPLTHANHWLRRNGCGDADVPPLLDALRRLGFAGAVDNVPNQQWLVYWRRDDRREDIFMGAMVYAYTRLIEHIDITGWWDDPLELRKMFAQTYNLPPRRAQRAAQTFIDLGGCEMLTVISLSDSGHRL